MIANGLVKGPPYGPGIPKNCLDCGEGLMGGGPELTFEDIVKWVESVWLDPQIRAGLDEKAWWRFIESLEKYAQKVIISREE